MDFGVVDVDEVVEEVGQGFAAGESVDKLDQRGDLPQGKVPDYFGILQELFDRFFSALLVEGRVLFGRIGRHPSCFLSHEQGALGGEGLGDDFEGVGFEGVGGVDGGHLPDKSQQGFLGCLVFVRMLGCE